MPRGGDGDDAGDDAAGHQSKEEVRHRTNLESVRVIANGNTAAITEERTARIGADSAQVETINGLSLRVGSAEGAIIEQSRIQFDNNAFQATQIQSINIALYDPENGLGVAHGKIFEERNARISADSAQLQSIDALLLRMGSAEGAIVEERRIQFGNNAFQGSQIEAINIALYDRLPAP